MAGVTQGADPESLPPGQLRASDADRAAVVERLRVAYDDGRLDLAEYDERVRTAYAARTYAELARLTADLPPGVAMSGPVMAWPAISGSVMSGSAMPGSRVPGGALARRPERDAGVLLWRMAGSSWFTVNLVCIVIWGIGCVAAGSWLYPWWIWVAGPWGAVLLASWIASAGRRRGHGS